MKLPVRKFSEIDYGGDPGDFCLLGWSFESCRELFGDMWDSKKRVLMYNAGSRAKNVVLFLSAVEKKLKLKTKTKCGVVSYREDYADAYCIDNGLLWFVVSPWWVGNAARKAFFTIVLRAGENYIRDFDRALFSVDYTQDTKYATSQFMSGYTRFKSTGHLFSGWVRTFDPSYNYKLGDGEVAEKRINKILLKGRAA